MVNSIAVAPAADAVSNVSVPSNANTNNDQTTTDEGTNNEDTEAQADDGDQTRKDANKLQDALKAATKGITDFLSETALHGPKYITFKDNKAIRITWVSTNCIVKQMRVGTVLPTCYLQKVVMGQTMFDVCLLNTKIKVFNDNMFECVRLIVK